MKIFFFKPLSILLMTVFMYACTNRMEKFDLAKKDADYIIENLDKDHVIAKFPEKHFPKDQTKIILSDIKNNCNWSQKKGSFDDYIEVYSNGEQQISVIYKYETDCGKLKFNLTYIFPNEKPELFKIGIDSF